ncbi:hypothetical protein [Candidatus Nanohalococcus occultus]
MRCKGFIMPLNYVVLLVIGMIVLVLASVFAQSHAQNLSNFATNATLG